MERDFRRLSETSLRSRPVVSPGCSACCTLCVVALIALVAAPPLAYTFLHAGSAAPRALLLLPLLLLVGRAVYACRWGQPLPPFPGEAGTALELMLGGAAIWLTDYKLQGRLPFGWWTALAPLLLLLVATLGSGLFRLVLVGAPNPSPSGCADACDWVLRREKALVCSGLAQALGGGALLAVAVAVAGTLAAEAERARTPSALGAAWAEAAAPFAGAALLGLGLLGLCFGCARLGKAAPAAAQRTVYTPPRAPAVAACTAYARPRASPFGKRDSL